MKKGNIERIAVPDFHKLVQTPDFYLDVSKLRGLGFQSQYDVYETIAEIVDYYEETL